MITRVVGNVRCAREGPVRDDRYHGSSRLAFGESGKMCDRLAAKLDRITHSSIRGMYRCRSLYCTGRKMLELQPHIKVADG